MRAVGASKLGDAVRRVGSGLRPLSSSVFFSSVASFVPTAGQANYAAANIRLDNLAARHAMQGIPCASMQWGGWADVGMAARSRGVLRRLQQQGLGLVPAAAGLGLLEATCAGLTAGRVRTHVPIASPLDGRTLQDVFGPAKVGLIASIRSRPRAPAGRPAGRAPARTGAEGAGAAGTGADGLAYVQRVLLEVVGNLVGRAVGVDDGLLEAGIDSLSSMELQRAINDALGVQVAPSLVFDYPTIAAIAGSLARSVVAPRAAPAAVPGEEDPGARIHRVVAGILERDVGLDESLLAAGFDSLSAMELQSSLNGMFRVTLPPSAIFDYPTIADLAAYLGSIQKPALPKAGSSLGRGRSSSAGRHRSTPRTRLSRLERENERFLRSAPTARSPRAAFYDTRLKFKFVDFEEL